MQSEGSSVSLDGSPWNATTRQSGNVPNKTMKFLGACGLLPQCLFVLMAAIAQSSLYAEDSQAVTDPVALSVRFDSQALDDKRPFGAVPAGSTVAFALHAKPGVSLATLVIEKRRLEGNQTILDYTELARVPLEPSLESGLQTWRGRYTFTNASVYGYYFELKIRGANYVYQNNNMKVYWSNEPGDNGLGVITPAPDSTKQISRYRHTVYLPDFKVPEWAQDAVYYYIFPERFRNGDPSHLPNPAVDTYHGLPVEVHHNWLDKPWKPHSGDGSDNIACNDFFGGDIAGIIEKLDYIASVGANTLYINPMFEAPSNHKYDTADYTKIDPHFGSNDDFVRLCSEAAKRGIRVLPDTSINHTGSESVYFDLYGNYGGKGAYSGGKINPSSPYADWYTFYPDQKNPNKRYKAWEGVDSMPEVNKASPSFRAFIYGNKDGIMEQWLDRGAAGWRMDVAPWVSDDFWREWRKAVKQHKPDALTVAETWFDASKFFLGDEFDSTMNYIFRSAVIAYANGARATQAYRSLEYMREVYPQQSLFALMNVLSSHDVARSVYVFGYKSETTPEEAVREAKQRLLLAVFLQMTYPGSPTIYYGDEVGVTGGDDPYDRAGYPWSDRGGNPDNALLQKFRSLVKLRTDNPILRRGSLDAPLLLNDHVIVLVRHLADKWAITACNNDTSAQRITVTLPEGCAASSFVDALSRRSAAASGRNLTLEVPPLFGLVLISN